MEAFPLSFSMMGFSVPASPVCPVNSGGGGAEDSGGDEHRRSATRGLLGSLSRRKGGFGILQLLLGGGGRLLSLRLLQIDRKSTRLNSSHTQKSRMPSSA